MQDKGGGVTKEEAIAFVCDVKVKFQDKREMYDEFLKVLSDYRAKRIDIAGVTTRMEELFKGHSDLILKFKSFTPKPSQISDDTGEKEEDTDEQKNPPDRIGSQIQLISQEVKLLSQKADKILEILEEKKQA
jgi:histone deacetylase complex regulatory component SIN3